MNMASTYIAGRYKASQKRTNALSGERFGVWLRQLRERKNLPLRAVAAAAEMDQSHLSKAELGQRVLTADQSAALAKFFNVDRKEMEARRIAEMFRQEFSDNPAAGMAVRILNEEGAVYG